MRTFPAGYYDEVARFHPESLAAPFQVLQAIARERLIECVCHAVIVLHSEFDALLTEERRLELWDAWGVPVFEQIWKNGELIAAECEAHDGLHIRKTETLHNGGEIIRVACGCGESSPRLVIPEIAPAAMREAAAIL